MNPCDVPWDRILDLLETRILTGMTAGGFGVLAFVFMRWGVPPVLRAWRGHA